jgi:serine/threonine protein kinase
MEHPGDTHTCWNCGTTTTMGQGYCHRCGSLLNNQQLKDQRSETIPTLNVHALPLVHTTDPYNATELIAAGTILGQRYRVVSVEGIGSFGTIYKAQDTRFQSWRVVAVKEMSNVYLDAHEKDWALQSLRQEAELLVQLKHPNLPSVFDFFEENGEAYLVMEFIKGSTLERELEITDGPMDEALVMRWALQLCDVLHYLHTRQPSIIFRDLKPSNVMITDETQIKLIDFGIARIFKVQAETDTRTLGSRCYAAPEQYGGSQSDARTDIYALGATLYKLLTGTAPLEVPLRQANAAVFRTPRELNPGLSIVTEQIILKAMNLQPGDRFQSAIEMSYAIGSSGAVSFAAGGEAPDADPRMSLEDLGDPLKYSALGLSVSSHKSTPISPLLTSDSGGSGDFMALPNMKSHPVTYPPGLPPPTPGPSETPIPSTSESKRLSRRHVLAAGLGAAGILALGSTTAAYLFSNRGPGPVINRSAANTINIPFTCSTEKVEWMTAAVNAFHQSNATLDNKTIQIELDLRGSLDAQQKILNGTIQPIIWSPASFLELNQLITAWEQAHTGKDIVFLSGDLQPKQLVFSPLVFAAWQNRSEVLLRNYASIDWPSIHDALKLSNWANIGGQSTWGPVKFGHTRPDKSNSGLLAITLMAYSFFKEQRELTVQQIDNPQFLSYFNDIEGAVSAFGRSSGTFLTNVVIPLGPPEFDIIATYENLILTNNKTAMAVQHQPLQLFYPGLNIVSDHPFAILQGNWVTHEQQMAARIFRDFLLAAPQQRLALATGFRPANVNVHITDKAPGNVFLQQSPYHITPKPDIEPLAQVPTSVVINELIKQWKISYDGSPITLG